MKQILVIIIFLIFFLVGCSTFKGLNSPVEPSQEQFGQYVICNRNNWIWNMGLYQVSADHANIERLPIRSSELHYNINTFIEPLSCNSCLIIGKPNVQPDGTIKISVMMTHPFPGQPKYTGFDVRGIIMFKATRYWQFSNSIGLVTKYGHKVYKDVPINFSLAQDGGAELLNADGYTIYFNTSFDLGDEFSQPVFAYSKGKYAQGVDPDSTINGFKLFTKDPDRRMFRTTDTITRVYHVAPPEGEFTFGYVVDASWAPSTKTPVIDPKNDFPFWANCEEGYELSFVQLQPFKTGGFYGGNGYLSQTTFLLYPDDWNDYIIQGLQSDILCPDIAPTQQMEVEGIARSYDGYIQIGPETYFIPHRQVVAEYTAPPGDYPAVVVSHYYLYKPQWPYQIVETHLFDIITLHVEQGD